MPDSSLSTSDCAEGTDLIYVVSQDTESLYSFDPPTLKFTDIGPLHCTTSASPFAMSVARDGTAWVLYDDGNIFHVSTKDASCTPTAYAPGQNGFTVFGMGFSADAVGSSQESLFVCWTEGLARIDTTSFALSPVRDHARSLDVSTGWATSPEREAASSTSFIPGKRPSGSSRSSTRPRRGLSGRSPSLHRSPQEADGGRRSGVATSTSTPRRQGTRSCGAIAPVRPERRQAGGRRRVHDRGSRRVADVRSHDSSAASLN